MKSAIRLTLTLTALLVPAWATSARASGFETKNTQICEIKGNAYDFADLQKAADLYKKSLNRGCTWLISFLHNGTMTMTEKMTIEGMPVHNGFGTMLSRPSYVDFTLDASGLGNCPIVVQPTPQAVLPKIDIKRITIKADDPKKAICKPDGTALYDQLDGNGHVQGQTEAQTDYVYIHPDVTILKASGGGGFGIFIKPEIVPVLICAVNPEGPSCDEDGDGVKNKDDQCEGTAPGTKVNKHGCPDEDQDGVQDLDDKCGGTLPNTPVDAEGCPIPDADDDQDDDGVTNDKDKCPNTPQNTPVNADGCPDEDGDGVVDGTDQCPGTTSGTYVAANGCPDQDKDGLDDDKDHCDLSSTGGICDSGTLTACFPDAADNICQIAGFCDDKTDSDNDGWGNRCDSDVDGDGVPNGSDPKPFDPDADGDGTCDGSLAVNNILGVCLAGPDQCPLDGGTVTKPCNPTPPTPNGGKDTDGDGLTDDFETVVLKTDPNLKDTDGDGAYDGMDCYPNDAGKFKCGGTTILIDPDFDNDGICDQAIEAIDPITNQKCTPYANSKGDNCPATHNPDQKDANGNGLGDACEPSPSLNENDADGDGLDNDMEINIFHTNPNNPDTDGDGIPDGEEVNGPTYLDGQGPNNPDVDGDQICDGPVTVIETPETCPDGKTDNEEGCDTSEFAVEVCKAGPDNCPLVENPEQVDENGDGIGDVCFGNFDGDLKSDAEDNCIFVPNDDQGDFDGDGLGDACDLALGLGENIGPQGCGCRIDAKGPQGAGGLLPFLAMMLPLMLFKAIRTIGVKKGI